MEGLLMESVLALGLVLVILTFLLAAFLHLQRNFAGLKQEYAGVLAQKRNLETALWQSDIYTWRYDIKARRAYPDKRLQERLQLPEIVEDFPEGMIRGSAILPEYWRSFAKMHQALAEGAPEAECQLQIMKSEEVLSQWFNCRYTTSFDQSGCPEAATGTLRCIDRQKSLENRLKTFWQQHHIISWIYYFDTKKIILDKPLKNQAGVDYLEINKVPDEAIREGRVHPEDAPAYQELYRRLEHKETYVSTVIRLKLNLDKEFRWYRLTYNSELNRKGCPVQAAGEAVDINEMMDAKGQFQTLLDHILLLEPNALAFAYLNVTRQKVLHYNSRSKWLEMPQLGIGNDLDAWRQAFLLKIVDSLDVQQAGQFFTKENLERLCQEGQSCLVREYRYRLAGDKVHWLALHIRLFKGLPSDDLMALCFLNDIDAEKLQVQALHSLAAEAAELVCYLRLSDRELVPVLLPPAGAEDETDRELKLHQGDYDTLLAEYAASEVVPEEQKQFLRDLEVNSLCLALNGAANVTVTYHQPAGAGRAVRQKSLTVSHLEDNPYILLLARRDITETFTMQQKYEQKLAESKLEVQTANSAKREFLSRMSHEIRSPLNAILGLSTLGLEDALDKNLAGYFNKIRSSGNYLMGLINDILDMAKIENNRVALHPEVVNIKDFLENIQTIIRPQAVAKRVEVAIRAENIQYAAAGFDRLRVQQIIMNLLTNAVKFSPADQSSLVECVVKDIGGDAVRRDWQVVVKDRGVGISEEFKDRIFQPFEQDETNEPLNHAGTGLGLAICKNLSELMEGGITVDSTLGRGSTFTVTLKVWTVASATKAPSGGTVKAVRHDIKEARILVVEDHPLNLEIAKRLLERAGATVETAVNGQEAVQLFRKSAPGYFNLILMDVRMPVMDGLKATRVIRHLDRGDAKTIPIVAMTANAFASDEDDTRAAGMNAHLSKPVEPKVMIRTIASLL